MDCMNRYRRGETIGRMTFCQHFGRFSAGSLMFHAFVGVARPDRRRPAMCSMYQCRRCHRILKADCNYCNAVPILSRPLQLFIYQITSSVQPTCSNFVKLVYTSSILFRTPVHVPLWQLTHPAKEERSLPRLNMPGAVTNKTLSMCCEINSSCPRNQT